MPGDAGYRLAWHMQVFDRRPSHCMVAKGDGTALRWVESWIDLASVFESAGMQRGRQVKHTAVLRRLGRPNNKRAVWEHACFIG